MSAMYACPPFFGMTTTFSVDAAHMIKMLGIVLISPQPKDLLLAIWSAGHELIHGPVPVRVESVPSRS